MALLGRVPPAERPPRRTPDCPPPPAAPPRSSSRPPPGSRRTPTPTRPRTNGSSSGCGPSGLLLQISRARFMASPRGTSGCTVARQSGGNKVHYLAARREMAVKGSMRHGSGAVWPRKEGEVKENRSPYCNKPPNRVVCSSHYGTQPNTCQIAAKVRNPRAVARSRDSTERFPSEWNDILGCLNGFTLKKSEIWRPGETRPAISKAIDAYLNTRGWGRSDRLTRRWW